MLNKISVLFLSGLAYFSLAPLARVFADHGLDFCVKGAGSRFGSLCDLSTGSVSKAIQSGITILFIIAVVVALFFLIYGGIKWISSGGDKTQLETARNTIIASIIGLILVLSSFFILNITLNFFGLPNVNNLKIPTLGSGGSDKCGGCPSGLVCLKVGSNFVCGTTSN